MTKKRRPYALKIIEIEEKTNTSGDKFTPILNDRIEHWVIVNNGKLTIDGPQCYNFSIRLLPQNLFVENNDTNNYKLSVNAKILACYYYMAIPGRILKREGLIMESFINEPKEISFLNNKSLFPKQLKNIIDTLGRKNYEWKGNLSGLLDNLDRSFFLQVVQGDQIILISSAEIARHYFLTGKILSKNLIAYDSYLPNSCILTEDAETNEKVYFGKFDHRLSVAEIRTLALLAVSDFAYRCAELMYRRLVEAYQEKVELDNSLSKEEEQRKDKKTEAIKYLKSFIPYEGNIKLGTTGVYLDKNKKIFLVLQIHQSMEVNPFFDRIEYLPIVDYRSLADKEKRDQLPEKPTNNRVLYETTPKATSVPNKNNKENDKENQDIDNIIPGNSDSRLLEQSLIDNIDFLSFFDNPSIVVRKRKKTDQEFKHTGRLIIKQRNGDNYSSEDHKSDNNNIAGLAELLFIREAETAFKTLTNACRELLEEEGIKINYIEFDKTREQLNYKSADFINSLSHTKSVIIEVIYKQKFYFYLIDLCYESDTKFHFIGFFYNQQFQQLTYLIIQELLDCKITHGLSWGVLKQKKIITSVNVQQFNRNDGYLALRDRIFDAIKLKAS